MHLVGDYRYSSAIVDNIRYAIIRNGNAIERIRLIGEKGNPVIWKESQLLSNKVLDIIAAELPNSQ